MMVIVFCTSLGSMYPGNLTRTILSEDDSPRGQRTRRCRPVLQRRPGLGRQVGPSWGRGWLSGGGLARGESQLHPLGVLDGHAGPRGHHRHGCSYENRGRQSTLAEYRVTCPARGPDCETGRKRAHLRFGRRTGWRVIEQARTMVPHHPRCEGRPERCSRADDN